MKKILNKCTAVLAAAAVTVSAVGVNGAEYCGGDRKISQEENISEYNDPGENTAGKNNIDKRDDFSKSPEEAFETTELTSEEQTDGAAEEAENPAEALGEEENCSEEPNEEETDNRNPGDTNIDITNLNYVYVENNTGDVYINIYNNIGVDAGSADSGADVSLESCNQIAVLGEASPEETTEAAAETVTETEASAEAATETASESITKTKASSSGRASSKKSSGSSGGKSADAGVYSSEIKEDEPSAAAQRTACMTIGSSLLNIDGEITQTDSAPYISQCCTLVPLRCISAVFDAQVEWSGETKTAKIKTEDIETEFVIGSDTMTVNGEEKAIPKSAEISGGRTYVPLRALGEALGADVSWIPESKSVIIIR